MNVFTEGMIQACQIADCLPLNFIYIVNLFLIVTYMVGREERKMLFMSYSCKLCEFSNRHQAKPPMCPKDLGIEKCISGGLIVVSSYVPKTTKQVEELKSQFGHNLKIIEGQCLGLTHGQKFGIAYSEEEDSAYEHESKIQPKGHSVIVIPSAATRQSVDSDESKLIGTKEPSEGPVTITNRTENEVDDVNEQSSADS